MKEKGNHETFLGRAHPLGKVFLPLSRVTPAPGPSSVPTWEKANCKGGAAGPSVDGAKDGSPPQGWQPSAMQHHAGSGPRDLQTEQEAGASLDQVGTTKH